MKQTENKNLQKPKSAPPKQTASKEFDVKWWLAASVFVIFTAIFFWQQLIGSAFFWEDFAEYVYPVQSFAAREFSKGILPFWNPYSFVGMPFLADLQVGFFYPLNRILSLFVSGDGQLSVGMLQFVVIIHFVIAQLTMYFTAKHFKISSFGSMISAVSYAFSFLFVCHVIHPMIVSHLAWLPLILLLLHKTYTEKNFKSAILSGLLFGMIMLSGHPQMTLFIGLFLGLFLLWFVVADLLHGSYKDKRFLSRLLAGVIPFIIALGIFQIQFLPSSELAGLSKRSEITYETAAEGSIETDQIFSMIVPKIFGYSNSDNTPSVPFYLKASLPGDKTKETPYYYYWETSFYFGLAAIMLGLFAALTMYKNRFVAFLIAFIIFAILFALGSNSFLLGIFHELPFFSQLRIPARMMFGAAFGFSILAGFGFDRLRRSEAKSDLWKLLVSHALPIFVGIIAAIGILPSLLGAKEQFIPALSGFGTIALVISLAIFAVSFLHFKNILNRLAAGSLLVLIVFIDLYIAGSDFNISKISIAKQYELQPATVAAFKPKYLNDLFRVNMRIYNPSYMAMKRNQGMISEIQLIEGYNPLLLERVMPPLNAKKDVHALYNVKYEIAIDEVRGIPYFVEDTFRLPRAYLVGDAIIENKNSVEKFMRNNKVDYTRSVVLEGPLPFELSKNDSTPVGKVEILEYSSNYIKMQVDAERNGVLCLSEIYYPAWKAVINGQDGHIYRSNYCFRAVAIAKGSHVVELKYSSAAFEKGAWLSVITLFLSLGALVLIEIKKKKSKKQ